jgi:hypothetical protein
VIAHCYAEDFRFFSKDFWVRVPLIRRVDRRQTAALVLAAENPVEQMPVLSYHGNGHSAGPIDRFGISKEN